MIVATVCLVASFPRSPKDCSFCQTYLSNDINHTSQIVSHKCARSAKTSANCDRQGSPRVLERQYWSISFGPVELAGQVHSAIIRSVAQPVHGAESSSRADLTRSSAVDNLRNLILIINNRIDQTGRNAHTTKARNLAHVMPVTVRAYGYGYRHASLPAHFAIRLFIFLVCLLRHYSVYLANHPQHYSVCNRFRKQTEKESWEKSMD